MFLVKLLEDVDETLANLFNKSESLDYLLFPESILFLVLKRNLQLKL